MRKRKIFQLYINSNRNLFILIEIINRKYLKFKDIERSGISKPPTGFVTLIQIVGTSWNRQLRIITH